MQRNDTKRNAKQIDSSQNNPATGDDNIISSAPTAQPNLHEAFGIPKNFVVHSSQPVGQGGTGIPFRIRDVQIHLGMTKEKPTSTSWRVANQHLLDVANQYLT